MSVRPKPSIRVAWDGEPEHPSYIPKEFVDGPHRSSVPVSAVASAAVVVVKNNTPAAEIEDEELRPLRASYTPSDTPRKPQRPPVRTERTQIGVTSAPTDSYVPPRPTDPPRGTSRPPRKKSEPPPRPKAKSQPPPAPPSKSEPPKSEPPPVPRGEGETAEAARNRRISDEFDFENQVRAEGALLSAQHDEDEGRATDVVPSVDPAFDDALDDETDLAQAVSEPPPAIEDNGRQSPPPTPSTPAKARISTVDGKALAPPPVPAEKRKRTPSQEAPAAEALVSEADGAAAEDKRDLAAISVVTSDVVITDGAAVVETSPKKSAARASKPGWYETFFDESYLRTYRVPPPDAVSRQCDFIEGQLDLAEGARILDVGCGLGLQAKELSRRGYEVTAIDASPTMLALAREADHGVRFVQQDMRELSFDAEFDGVVFWGTTFGYFDDAQNKHVIEQVRNAVRPNGMLLIDVVNRDYVMRSQPNLIWFEGDGCVCLEESDFNAITSRLYVKRTTVLSDGRQLEAPYSMRLYSVHELGQVLHNKGFRAKRVSGHPATPGVFFGPDSPRIIMAAERRAASKMERNTVTPADVAKRRSS